uniref:Uncharacterized protein n=1 Tax=Physcomitrium patens TaxID=3218 RepID=A0A2K1KU96_PHYPA|nr:hypothetical protein PHYPA_004356 [Physcomitrium patens]
MHCTRLPFWTELKLWVLLADKVISGKKIDLTYPVQWEDTNISFIRRFNTYLEYPFNERQMGVKRERRDELQGLCSN